MKHIREALLIVILCLFCSSAMASEPMKRWDNLMDFTHKFSWYPKEDLKSLLESQGGEYGKTFEEYCAFLSNELRGEESIYDPFTKESFVTGKPWKSYYRLALAQYCLFLLNNDTVHLKNAGVSLSFLSAKKGLVDVSYWDQIIRANTHLVNNNREGFISTVSYIWQDIIFKLESQGILMDTPFVKNLPYLYENIAHLVITRGITEMKLIELYPLSFIIKSIEDKLQSDSGYKPLVKAVVHRMKDLKSDNDNLNFAVAFVEATSKQYEFESEKNTDLLKEKYEAARSWYELSLAWADSEKGKAAIFTPYMGFLSYAITKLDENNQLLASNPYLKHIPDEGNVLAGNALDLYESMAGVAEDDRGITSLGFSKRENYLKGMHQLWDSASKFLIIISEHYSKDSALPSQEKIKMVEKPLLRYISFFRKYTRTERDIVPDNAFFLAAYAAKELSGIYQEASDISLTIAANDLAIAYQLQSIELFPLDIVGVMELSYQTYEEGRLNLYMKYVTPVAYHMKKSKVVDSFEPDQTTKGYPPSVFKVIPHIIENAPSFVKYIKNINMSPDELAEKSILMAKIVSALENDYPREIIEGVLTTVAASPMPESGASMESFLNKALPEDIFERVRDVPDIYDEFKYTALMSDLFSSLDNNMHTFLRQLYFETPQNDRQYMGLKKKHE